MLIFDSCLPYTYAIEIAGVALMKSKDKQLSECLQRGDPLRMLLEGTASTTGERFFEALVKNLALALDTKCAWVTEYVEPERRLYALAFWVDGTFIPDFSIDIDNTPCEDVIDHAQRVHYPDGILDLFPTSTTLKELHAVSYLAVPLLDLDETVLGHLAVIDDRPMLQEPKNLTIFHIFAERAAAELRRLRATAVATQREEQLNLLVQSAMDGIIKLDDQLNMIMVNPTAEKILNIKKGMEGHQNLGAFLNESGQRKVKALIQTVSTRQEGSKYMWVPGGLHIFSTNGEKHTVEATLSQFEWHNNMFYTLIIRDIQERLLAEKKIRQLSDEADYLKYEINRLDNFEEVIGESKALQTTLQKALQVASTETSVMILGETGTGKELIAHAIHRFSYRADKPLIKVNCAALSPNLVESELFGHEAGAFTGAERKRKGRFELADGGTIFLDEIGEMPLAVQIKLLRVLQEGCFERVGGSVPIDVDVRLIAATHRDLLQEIDAGRFRSDLYYRIHVYPITVPPLRDRKEDIPALIHYFTQRLGHRVGKRIDHIPNDTMEQFIAYDWPGNVRELKNVVERAMITSDDNTLHLPERLVKRSVPASAVQPDSPFDTLDRIEKQYITHVLQAKGWRISGPKGAAKVLGLNPSTLRYRIGKLGIRAYS